MKKIKSALVFILIIFLFISIVSASTPTFFPTPMQTPPFDSMIPAESPISLSGTITINPISDIFEYNTVCLISGTSTYPFGTVLKYGIINGDSSIMGRVTPDENGYWELEISSPNIIKEGLVQFIISDLNEDEIFSSSFQVNRQSAPTTETAPPVTATPLPPYPPQQSGGEEAVLSFLAKAVAVVCAAVLIVVGYMRVVCSREPESKTMKILTYIKKNPGSLESDIVKGTGFSRGSTVHALKKLIKENLISSENYHKTVRYYPADSKEKMKMIVEAVLSKEKPALIFNTIKENPGITLAGISEKTKLTKQTVRWYLEQFKTDCIVSAEKEGKIIHYSVSDVAKTE